MQSQKRKELQEILFQLLGKDERKSLFVLSFDSINLSVMNADKYEAPFYYLFYISWYKKSISWYQLQKETSTMMYTPFKIVFN